MSAGTKSATAPMLLDCARRHMEARAATYDKPGGERSMDATVAAFNAITGRDADPIAVVIKPRISTLLINLRTGGEHSNITNVIEQLEVVQHFLSNIHPAALTESEGWMLMSCLKMVRDRQRQQPHVDSIEDNIAYAALYGEARLREVQS